MRRLALVCSLLCLASLARADDACAGRGARSLLAITPFEMPIPSLHWGEQVTDSFLEQWFGKPTRLEQIPYEGREEPGIVTVARAWSFDGLRIEESHFEASSELWVNVVEVTSASRPLRCGIRVGMPLERLREILGPREQPSDPESEDESRCFQFEQDPDDELSPAASLCVVSDAQGVVTQLRWTPISRC